MYLFFFFFFFSSRRRHTRSKRDWSSDVCSSDLVLVATEVAKPAPADDEMLVKVHAVSVNRSDWEGLTGKPFYARFGGLLKRSEERRVGKECRSWRSTDH